MIGPIVLRCTISVQHSVLLIATLNLFSRIIIPYYALLENLWVVCLHLIIFSYFINGKIQKGCEHC